MPPNMYTQHVSYILFCGADPNLRLQVICAVNHWNIITSFPFREQINRKLAKTFEFGLILYFDFLHFFAQLVTQ